MRIKLALASILCLALVAPSAASAQPAAKAAELKAQIAKCNKTKKKKKKCKKRPAVVAPAPAPAPAPSPLAPLAMTDTEALTVTFNAAYQAYLAIDEAYDWGAEQCVALSTFNWRCVGWIDVVYSNGSTGTCDWYQYVDRVGYNGTSTHKTDITCY